MKSKKIAIHLFFIIQPMDLMDFYKKVIKIETDKNLKKEYKRLFWAQILMIPIIFIGFAILAKINV